MYPGMAKAARDEGFGESPTGSRRWRKPSARTPTGSRRRWTPRRLNPTEKAEGMGAKAPLSAALLDRLSPTLLEPQDIMTVREGSLEAPTRHPLDWKSADFYDEDKLNHELERVYDICHGCRRCVNLCTAFPSCST
jgi:hypothetical protein